MNREYAPTIKPPSRQTEVNLHELQRTLDAQGLEIVENQKENVVGRKKLAEQTRGEPFPCFDPLRTPPN